jgi:hypothetical protein
MKFNIDHLLRRADLSSSVANKAQNRANTDNATSLHDISHRQSSSMCSLGTWMTQFISYGSSNESGSKRPQHLLRPSRHFPGYIEESDEVFSLKCSHTLSILLRELHAQTKSEAKTELWESSHTIQSFWQSSAESSSVVENMSDGIPYSLYVAPANGCKKKFRRTQLTKSKWTKYPSHINL